jgi:hypothetical protein
MLPIIIHEQIIQFFRFYRNGNLQHGMSYRGQLYKLVKSFPTHTRSEAYALGNRFSHQGYQSVITVTLQTYRVWIELRAPVELETVELRSQNTTNVPTDELNPYSNSTIA